MVNEDDNSSSLQHRNHDPKPWVIQKFGGTSVGKFADKIAEDLVRSENTPVFHWPLQHLILTCI